MPIHKTCLFMLSYDIADPKRLQQVHRTVRQVGIPLQYSVFLILATAIEIDQLLIQLDEIINPKRDDIRVYPLPQKPEVFRYGRQHLPIGLELIPDQPLRDAFIHLVGPPEEG